MLVPDPRGTEEQEQVPSLLSCLKSLDHSKDPSEHLVKFPGADKKPYFGYYHLSYTVNTLRKWL